MAMRAHSCVVGICCATAAAALRAGREVKRHAEGCGVVWGST